MKKLGDKINTLRDGNLGNEDKKKFLGGVPEQIIVKAKDKHTQLLEIKFKSPFVCDTFELNEINKSEKGYKLINGKDISIVELTNSNKGIQQKL